MEMIPEHQVTKALHEQWHKIAAVMMKKMGISYLHITDADLVSMGKDTFIIVHGKPDGLHISLTDQKTAEAIISSDGRASH